MKLLMLAAIVIMSIGTAAAASPAYHAPAHNYYQNNWMSSE